MIKKLTLTNLRSHKQLTIDELSTLNFIHGPNGAGKTSIRIAIELALTGRREQGKTPGSIMQAAGPGAEMTIELECTGGESIKRGWKRTATGAAKLKFPEPPEMFDAVCLDAGEFMGLNANGRARVIASRFGIEQADPAQELAAAIAESGAPQHDAPASTGDFNAFVNEYEAFMKGKISEHRAAEKAFTTTLQTLTFMDAAPPEQVTGLEVKRTKVARLAEQIAQLMRQATDAQTLAEKPCPDVVKYDAERRKEVTEAIANLKAAETKSRAWHLRAAGIKKDLASAESDAAACDSWIQAYYEQQSATYEDVACDDAEAIETEFERATAESRATDAGKIAVAIVVKDGEFVALECGGVEYTGGLGRTSNAAIAVKVVIDLNLNREEQVQQRLESATKHFAALKWQRGEAEREKMQAKYDLAAVKVATLKAALSEPENFTEDQGQQLAGLEEELNAILESSDSAAKYAEVNASNAEIRRKMTMGKEAEKEAKILENELSTDRAELADMEVKSKLYVEYQTGKKTQEKAREGAKEAAESLDHWQAALDVLQGKAKQIAARLMMPLIERAAVLCADCLPSALAARGIEIGRYEGAHFIPLEEFSGSESAIAICAIQAALASTGRGVVILDEFNACDDAKKTLFMRNLDEALNSGLIVQAFVFDNAPPPVTLPGMKVVSL